MTGRRSAPLLPLSLLARVLRAALPATFRSFGAAQRGIRTHISLALRERRNIVYQRNRNTS
ncbi:exported hypothetical protein [Cupriavidus taiwanensis]|nr:exported hypothetical protein [Cupriavidus taiwanensis]SOY94373.1 exported hypothetical protein [Cupriavidus taiwanensis]SOZ27979.1 exported hypothetical protein [Cupriavidus taiwanensis]SOZ70521.1 exported hypothetical protein [Cupriavidus taiwanensis]SOZ86331.1 exported hypothetical protein [Cupriavidus taiwanensis]